MGDVEEFGRAATWLASPAASYIHGHALLCSMGARLDHRYKIQNRTGRTMKIVIAGARGVGGYFGGLLARSGQDVTFYSPGRLTWKPSTNGGYR